MTHSSWNSKNRYSVTASGKSGWVASNYLKNEGSHPQPQPHPQPHPQPQPTPSGGHCRSFTLFKVCDTCIFSFLIKNTWFFTWFFFFDIQQFDSRWAGNRLGSSSTIGKVGCLMTSVSMAMNSLGKKIDGQSVTPAVLNSFLRAHGGYSGNSYVWGAISRFVFYIFFISPFFFWFLIN